MNRFTPATLFLVCLEKSKHPVFQVQMHVRRRVSFLKIMPLHTVLAKLGIAKPQLFFSQVTHLLTPIAVRRSTSNYECFHTASKVLIVGELAPVHAARLVRTGTGIHGLLHPVAVAVI